jgi:hypothetical protein
VIVCICVVQFRYYASAASCLHHDRTLFHLRSTVSFLRKRGELTQRRRHRRVVVQPVHRGDAHVRDPNPNVSGPRTASFSRRVLRFQRRQIAAHSLVRVQLSGRDNVGCHSVLRITPALLSSAQPDSSTHIIIRFFEPRCSGTSCVLKAKARIQFDRFEG